MITGPGLIPTFLYYFVGTTFIVAFAVSQQTDTSLTSGAPYQVGILFGLFAGLTGAYFNRNLAVSAPFNDAAVFRQTLTKTLTEMGFQEQPAIADCLVYERSSLSGFFAVKVLVQLDTTTATISGRASVIRQLRKRLGI